MNRILLMLFCLFFFTCCQTTYQAKAEQEIFLAEGKAKAIKLEAEAMKANQSIVQMKSIDAQNRAIDKWNGKLKDYFGWWVVDLLMFLMYNLVLSFGLFFKNGIGF